MSRIGELCLKREQVHYAIWRETSLRLMEMRREMISLIGQRDALGGQETCPNIAERLRENYRPVRKVLGKRA